MNFIKQIFTWWNGSTLGTKVWTFLYGIQVGIDEDKNVYFQNKNTCTAGPGCRGVGDHVA